MVILGPEKTVLENRNSDQNHNLNHLISLIHFVFFTRWQ